MKMLFNIFVYLKLVCYTISIEVIVDIENNSVIKTLMTHSMAF